MNLKENFINCLEGKGVEKTPVVPITTITLMEYREKFNSNFPEAHTDSDKMVKLAVAPYEVSGIEGINLPFDMTIEAEAFGCEIDLRENEHTPEVVKTPFNEPSGIDVPSDFLQTSRVRVLEESIMKIQEKYHDVPLIIGVVGPFTLLGQLLGIENLLKYVKKDYYEVEDAIGIVTEALQEFISLLDSYKIDAICICEPSSSSDLLNPEIFKKLVKPELEILADTIKSKTILHVCGNTNPIIPDMLTCNYDAISIEDVVDINYITKTRKELNSNTKICGNISTNKALLLGTTKTVKDEATIALEKGVDILCSSCSVPPMTPEVNVNAMIKARDKYYDQKTNN
ncbi:MtaA/CmuA family methyltransferase [Methanosphaera sp.]